MLCGLAQEVKVKSWRIVFSSQRGRA